MNKQYPETTVAILNSGYSVIAVDDNCYVLYNQDEVGNWRASAWLYDEAIEAIKKLPLKPRDASYYYNKNRNIYKYK